MKVAFIGYMACGKSYWANKLANELEVEYLDLDDFLEMNYLGDTISNFIEKKGELPFRKNEEQALLALSKRDGEIILACGGGTPCYYDNMETLNNSFLTIYLNVSIKTIVERLKNDKPKRPLISHLKESELQEFVAKHLFERRVFYTKAKIVLNEDEISLENILAEIVKHK